MVKLKTIFMHVFQVQVDDQIVFESVKSSGQFLHVSKTLLGGMSVYDKR